MHKGVVAHEEAIFVISTINNTFYRTLHPYLFKGRAEARRTRRHQRPPTSEETQPPSEPSIRNRAQPPQGTAHQQHSPIAEHSNGSTAFAQDLPI